MAEDGEEAAAVVARLGLQPHPEGGWYRETWRAEAYDEDERSPGTAILYLLEAGQKSHWHRIDATELWIFQAGSALTLSTLGEGGAVRSRKLGPDVLRGDEPQLVVRPGEWQSAVAGEGWVLVTCVVMPGFEFSGFEMAPPGWAPRLGSDQT